jgi:hypothetical protein
VLASFKGGNIEGNIYEMSTLGLFMSKYLSEFVGKMGCQLWTDAK